MSRGSYRPQVIETNSLSPPPPRSMPPIPPLFTLPIEPSGSITCTQPSPKIYLLTFSAPPDNRLTVSFCTTFQLALDILAHRYPRGVVVSTSGIAKFYSNGLDYELATNTQGFFGNILYPLWRRLLTCVFSFASPSQEKDSFLGPESSSAYHIHGIRYTTISEFNVISPPPMC